MTEPDTFAARVEPHLRAVEEAIVPGTDWGRDFQQIIDRIREDARKTDAMEREAGPDGSLEELTAAIDESLALVTQLVAKHSPADQSPGQ
ncbi:hypothetical protein AMIS_34670 [Actinoplanes missouriensis 431]|uniref:Uncharacterized protein n=1 Tax=Actinoplanes missouriensis (strain ATCC 14538 / DSM 43046 / CBS 188.64 / JCM 3121 / NBRC 102363 / NCIMB 12654 / NRRL B-3342 / UNCC 431) TaxID=512565 RepID=I0H6Q0_ACTM4|nr:hypothetical protein [Actinoplanes missouriensis]BAL88687.1 hypothetical protein AMIS_34670 [Actinoplanes missouriensis 431]